MVRKYISSLSNHRNGKNHHPYFSYSPEAKTKALEAVQSGSMSPFKASKTFNIPKTTIYRMLAEKNNQERPGHPVLFSSTIERVFLNFLIMVSNWGFPFDEYDLRRLANGYLEEKQIEMPQLKENMPGVDWAKNFFKRHNKELAGRTATNISRKRAAVTSEILDEFFDNAEAELTSVPPENIINYDETCLSDNPGAKLFIFKRGCKHPERVVNNNPKSSISIMFSGTASGHVFPCYVVYKATQMWNVWSCGGPTGTRYNRSISGWFDTTCFTDWFKSIILPYCKRMTGKKIIIGDNLSSHFTPEVLRLCRENNIAFKCLPTNSTHIMQPLDVSYFAPLKKAWKEILSAWKQNEGRYIPALTKDVFPKLLLRLMEKLEVAKRGAENLKAGRRFSHLTLTYLPYLPVLTFFFVQQALLLADCTPSILVAQKNASHIIVLFTTTKQQPLILCPNEF